jgi:hypothetical protein
MGHAKRHRTSREVAPTMLGGPMPDLTQLLADHAASYPVSAVSDAFADEVLRGGQVRDIVQTALALATLNSTTTHSGPLAP